jgi:ribosomal protein L25 (general stress protein Ctc)
MKSIICNSIITVFLLISLQLSAQNKETRETGDFSKLTATGNIRVELYPSDKNYVELEVIGTVIDNLITENSEQEFHIRLKTSTPKEAKVLAKCYFVNLEKITSQNQALITGNKVINLKEVQMDARAGGKIELQIAVEHLTAEAKQGGVLVLNGEVEKQEVEVNSGGTYSAYQLEAKDSYIKCNTGSIAKVIARRIIDANASTKGYIAFVGNPVSNITKTSLGGEIDHFQEIPK